MLKITENYQDKVQLLNKMAHAYYTLDNPIATDEEYDLLYREVRAIEDADPSIIDPLSPTQRVGDVVLNNFDKGTHLKKMYSLGDIFDRLEANEWCAKFPAGTGFACEPKYDGASLNLIYENGKLVSAITRGDGEIGEDVTLNAPHVKGIPLSIPEKSRVEVRGEVTIMLKDFDEVNEFRVNIGKEKFSNPRNAASGALRTLESKNISGYKLHFTPYSIGEREIDFDYQTEEHYWFIKQGFSFWGMEDDIQMSFSTVTTPHEIDTVYQTMIANRDKYPMMLDGMVIKVNDKHLQEELGETSKIPRWAIAYKFPAVEKVTILEDVIVQVAKTGAQAPVGVLKTIEIGGANIRRVTLHNFSEIERLGLMIGDHIGIIRSGDVIPKVTAVFKDRRDGTQREVKRPTHCASCGSEHLDHSQVVIKCTNKNCDARVKGILEYAVGKKALDIDGVGEQAVAELVDKGIVKTVADLWSVTVDDLARLEGFKEKKINNAFNGIRGTIGTTEAHRVLNALDIDQIGQSASKKLATKFRERIFSFGEDALTYEDLINTEDIGDTAATSFVRFMSENRELVEDVINAIQPVFPEEKVLGDSFAGKKFVITGTLSKPRDSYKEIIEANGGKVSGSISGSTDYLLAGEKAGSKLDKAKGLGVSILDEEAFNALIA